MKEKTDTHWRFLSEVTTPFQLYCVYVSRQHEYDDGIHRAPYGPHGWMCPKPYEIICDADGVPITIPNKGARKS